VTAGEQDALVAVARQGRQHGWWQEYKDVLTEADTDFLIMEAAATEILGYEPHRVPVLLQTPGYARAVADADPALSDDAQRDQVVEVIGERQRIMETGRRPLMELLLGEGVLHQSVGAAGVMRDQLARLAEIADHGPDAGVSLRVLPFSAGAHAAAGCGGMSILRFAGTPGIGVIHLDGLSGGVSLDGPDEVARYLRAFTQLRLAALTPAASARLLRGA
jgi:hypothetical protein